MKKICFITATRAEYGLLKYLMREVERSEQFQLQVIVTGAHLMAEQGHTIDQIIEDGIKVDRTVDVHIDTETKTSIAESMGRMAQLFPKVFEEMSPDYVVVLGDRYELLPICNSAFVMGIPIIHISGGDITVGAIDNGIRNTVTMLAAYHFPGTEDSANNIIRMRGSDANVWAVGETGLDAFRNETLLSREELAESLGLKISAKWILFTYHSETKKDLSYNLSVVENCIRALLELENYQIVATYANTDYGGRQINEYLESKSRENPKRLITVPSLGNIRYLSFMKEVSFVVGNSSSGVVEAPSLGVSVVNIGDRQKGRHLCSNIIQCYGDDMEKLSLAIHKAAGNEVDTGDLNYWGDGQSSKRILEILKSVL